MRTLLVDRFDCTPVLVAGTRGYAFTGDGTFDGLLAASTCLGALCRLISVASSYSFSRQPGEPWAKMRVSLASPKWHSICGTQSLDASTALNCKVHRRISPKGDRMKSSLGRVQLAFVLLCLVAVPAHANLLTNGSFETPIVSVGGFTNFPVGSGALTGWTVFGPAGQAVSIVSGSFSQNGVSFPAQDGAQWVDLTGFNNNSTEGVSQSVATTVGHQYQLSYFIGNTTGGGIFGSTSTVDVLLNGAVAFTDTNSTSSPSTQNWGQFSHTFTASGAATIIGLRNADPGSDNDNGLDNVVLLDLGVPGTSVPEPGTLALFGLGLAGLGGITLRRRRRT